MSRIILASASPRRRELLDKAGIIFTVQVGEGDEVITSTDPENLVKELSGQKAESVIKPDMEDGTIIIGADTVVAYGGEILGKPRDEEDAFNMLSMLQDHTHQVYTGVTVLRRNTGEWIPLTFAQCTQVTCYPVSDREILDYIHTGEPMDKAGAYGIQGAFFVYVKKIDGDYSNVVGLPVSRLLYETKKQGIDLRDPAYRG